MNGSNRGVQLVRRLALPCRTRPRVKLRCLALLVLTGHHRVRVYGVEQVSAKVAVCAPAKVLATTHRQSDGQAVVGKPLNERQDERRRRPSTLYHFSQIDSVVIEQVGVDAFAVLVNQAAEAEASPT